ncbi:hypothetical protein [Flavobacterium sp.]|uniref:hypothetical protein n=1 Tax=Flavobacterium sp. TaxID=239 RepID=UPI003D12271A
MKNLLLVCVMILFAGTVMAQQTPQKKNTTKIVSDPTANPVRLDTVKNTAASKKSTAQKVGSGKKQPYNTTKIVSDPTANPVRLDTVQNRGAAKKSKAQKVGSGKKQQSNTTKIVSDPTADPVHLDTIKNPVKK